MDEAKIFRLLGLPIDASAQRIKAAYEGAVATATARGDWSRATELSRAFDDLPRHIRLAVYSGRERSAARFDGPAPEGRRRPEQGKPRRAWRAARLGRFVLAGAAVILTVFAGATWLKRGATPDRTALDALPTARPRVSAPSAPAISHRESRHVRLVRPHWVPMKALYAGVGEVRIPRNAVRDSRGRATVLCPNATGSVWGMVKARPLQLFVCPSGYVGRVLVRPHPHSPRVTRPH